MQIVIDPRVKSVFEKYPVYVRLKIDSLRDLIINTADEIDEVLSIDETLKWGEPSYLVDKGSTIRIDWKPKKPDQYAMYFKCTSKLVTTFRSVYKDRFNYEGNRAIVFKFDDEIPVSPLKKCITAALTYHRVKHLPLLGIK